MNGSGGPEAQPPPGRSPSFLGRFPGTARGRCKASGPGVLPRPATLALAAALLGPLLVGAAPSAVAGEPTNSVVPIYGTAILGDSAIDSLDGTLAEGQYPKWTSGRRPQTGAVAHELGHTFNLLHPGAYGLSFESSVMGAWWNCPTVGFNDRDRQILARDQSRFFQRAILSLDHVTGDQANGQRIKQHAVSLDGTYMATRFRNPKTGWEAWSPATPVSQLGLPDGSTTIRSFARRPGPSRSASPSRTCSPASVRPCTTASSPPESGRRGNRPRWPRWACPRPGRSVPTS